MSDHFSIVTTRGHCAVVHTPSHIEVMRDLSQGEADAALKALAGFDGNCKPSEARLGTWRGACRRAIARVGVKACR